MSAESDVLPANAAFFEAFRRANPRLMADVWADDASVVCVHPGQAPIRGRSAVLESWRQVFTMLPSCDLELQRQQAVVREEIAVVTSVVKTLGGTFAVTNLFMRAGGAWKLVHHHSGSMPRVPR
jgi:uncharacterized protein (TIGR02246 family)